MELELLLQLRFLGSYDEISFNMQIIIIIGISLNMPIETMLLTVLLL